MQIPATDESPHDDRPHDDLDAELLVSGFISPDRARGMAVEVKRDMTILTSEGRAAGRVAAVLIDKRDRQVTHILLSRRSQPPQYHLVPIALVAQVQEGQVVLLIFNQAVDSLPVWHGS